MSNVETLVIKLGTMINLSRHEDDDAEVALKDLEAQVVRKHKDAVEVVIPNIDPDRTFFIHQPESPSHKIS